MLTKEEKEQLEAMGIDPSKVVELSIDNTTKSSSETQIIK